MAADLTATQVAHLSAGMRQALLDSLQRIADAPSPSGYEQPAARVYRS